MKQSTRDILVSTAWIVAIVAIIFVPRCSMARPSAASAAQPEEIQKWFKQQRNSIGESCCSEADGYRFYGDYTINPDGSVTVEGEIIPKEKVLTGPNPTGAAVWWRVDMPDGHRRTYCFSPGGGT